MLTFKDWFYFVFIGGVFVPVFFLFMTHDLHPKIESPRPIVFVVTA